MKRIFILGFITMLITAACSMPKTRFDQTCITCIKSQRYLCSGDECPKTFIVGEDVIVTITETGENLFLNPILKEEIMDFKNGIPIAIAKINGKFYLVGEKFDFLWILYPNPDNTAGFKSIELPSKDILKPVFELFTGKLMLSSANFPEKYILDEDSGKWIIQGALKGKE